jgi:hypothetical protein
MIENIRVLQDEHGAYWIGDLHGQKVGNYYDVGEDGKRVQENGPETVLGKWYLFEDGIPVRPLTDEEVWGEPC